MLGCSKVVVIMRCYVAPKLFEVFSDLLCGCWGVLDGCYGVAMQLLCCSVV